MKIFLDDLRPFPEHGYECVRTYNQCILLLNIFKNKLETVNLDYDLGEEKTGLDVLKYMKDNGINPQNIIVHSTHPEGVPVMREFIKNNFPLAQYTYCPL